MRYRYRFNNIATLLFAVTFPLLPVTDHYEPVMAQMQTTQEYAEAFRLIEQGEQLLERSQFRGALEKFQQALAISREITNKRNEELFDFSRGLPRIVGYNIPLTLQEDLQQNLTNAYIGLGDYTKAVEYLQGYYRRDKLIHYDRYPNLVLINFGKV